MKTNFLKFTFSIVLSLLAISCTKETNEVIEETSETASLSKLRKLYEQNMLHDFNFINLNNEIIELRNITNDQIDKVSDAFENYEEVIYADPTQTVYLFPTYLSDEEQHQLVFGERLPNPEGISSEKASGIDVVYAACTMAKGSNTACWWEREHRITFDKPNKKKKNLTRGVYNAVIKKGEFGSLNFNDQTVCWSFLGELKKGKNVQWRFRIYNNSNYKRKMHTYYGANNQQKQGQLPFFSRKKANGLILDVYTD